MFPRTSAREYPASVEVRKARLKSLVDSGVVAGLLGYEEGRPVGWISLGPRPEFPRLQRHQVAKPVDEQPVWSIVCFVVDRSARRRGVSEALLGAAVDYARANGATLLEAYPIDTVERRPDVSLYWGVKSVFDRAGFEEVARRKKARPVVRKELSPWV
jgi:ribosomal protein S18 acetylase RimI-like enzyme